MPQKTDQKKKAYKNIINLDGNPHKDYKKPSTKLFTSQFVPEFQPPHQKPNIKNPVVVAIDGPGLYIGTVRIPYVRPPVVLPPFYESQKEKLQTLIKRIDSARIHKSSKIIPESLHLTFDHDVIMERAPVESFMEAMNKRIQASKPAPVVKVPIPEPTLFEILQADTLKKQISQPKLPMPVTVDPSAVVVRHNHKSQTLATQLAIGSIIRAENQQKPDSLTPSRPTVAYKDMLVSEISDPQFTLSTITHLFLKKLAKGNFTPLGIDSPVPNSLLPNSTSQINDFQDVSGLLHYNRIQINPLDEADDIIAKIEQSSYKYDAFDFLNKPLIRLDESSLIQNESKLAFMEPQDQPLKIKEKPIEHPHFLPNFLTLLTFESRTKYPELFRWVVFVESLKELPAYESKDARRLLDLISKLLTLPLSPELTLEYISLYDALSGLDKLPARLRILFRERIKSLLESHQGPIRIKLCTLFINCAGDKEYAVGVLVNEGAAELIGLVNNSKELLELAMKLILQDLKSSAPFDRVKALILIPGLIDKIDLIRILNENVSEHEMIIKTVLEEILVMAWEDWSLEVRELCIKVVSDLGLEKEIFKGILLQLLSPNQSKQIAAIKRVGEHKIVEGLACLVPCLTNAHIMIRIEAFKTVAMFDDVSDRLLMSGIMAGCTDIEPEVRIVSIQALRQSKVMNAQLRESLYYLLHYDPQEIVREEVVITIHTLGLVSHFKDSLLMILSSLKRGKLQEIISGFLTQAGYFIPKVDDKTLQSTTFSDIIISPDLYESMSAKEKEIVSRTELITEKEQDQLLSRINMLCTKEAIISQATNMEYTPLSIPDKTIE